MDSFPILILKLIQKKLSWIIQTYIVLFMKVPYNSYLNIYFPILFKRDALKILQCRKYTMYFLHLIIIINDNWLIAMNLQHLLWLSVLSIFKMQIVLHFFNSFIFLKVQFYVFFPFKIYLVGFGLFFLFCRCLHQLLQFVYSNNLISNSRLIILMLVVYFFVLD